MKVVVLWFLITFSSFGIASADTTKVRSVKALTHLLSKIERSHGEDASFTTMRLQIYLEDIYISQGTTLFIYHGGLAQALKSALSKGMTKPQISKFLLREYQRSEFYEN